MKFEELKTKLLKFENSLNEFMPIAETIECEANECNYIIEECRKVFGTYTEEEIKEIDSIGYRICDLCEKISDMF